MTIPSFTIAAGLALTLVGRPQSDPRRAMDELLDADRRHAAAASKLNVADALSALLADDVILSAAGAFHRGRDAAIAQLRSIPENLTAHVAWAPVRGGISADGRHGFTYGFMTVTRADGSEQPLKYLAYWVRGADGWKVAVYRRVLRPAGAVSTAMREPLLPPAIVPETSAAAVARYARDVGDAERAFSDLAGRIGLGPAFTQNGAPDAMNMGGPSSVDFVYGPEAIGAAVGAGEEGPSKLTWGPDTVLVASSGDLGVTIGHINAPAANGAPPRRIPFFTVWRKVGGVWKYVAE